MVKTTLRLTVLVLIFIPALIPSLSAKTIATTSEEDSPSYTDIVTKDLGTGEVRKEKVDREKLNQKFKKETVKIGHTRSYLGTLGTGKKNPTDNVKTADPNDPFNPDNVIGPDNRDPVTDTTAYPYRTIVYIYYQLDSGATGHCTGWLYDPNTVATAGHCVYDQDEGWISGAVVYPALKRDGDGGYVAPYGYANGKTVHTIAGWADYGYAEYDFGAISLDKDIGNQTGTMGFRVEDIEYDYLGQAVAITGYPGDKPDYTMWRDIGTITDQSGLGKMVYYDADTAAGQSGAPIYQSSYMCGTSTGYCALGIHAYGYETKNGGIRFNSFNASYYSQWKDE